MSTRYRHEVAEATLLVRAELEVRRADVGAFLDVARALERAAREEPGTLRYQWFEDPGEADPHRFVVLEEYVDAPAAFAHNEHCAGLLARAAGLATMTAVALHGPRDAELDAWVAAQPGARLVTPLP